MRTSGVPLVKAVFASLVAAAMSCGGVADCMAADSVQAAAKDRERISEEYEDGVKAGGFKLLPRLTLSGRYDDNIYANPAGEDHDWIGIVSLSLLSRSGWAKHSLELDLGLESEFFSRYTNENTTDLWAGVKGRYDFSESANIFGGFRYSYLHEDRTSPDAEDGIEPTTYNDMQGHAGMSLKAGLASLRFGGTFEKMEFKDTATVLGVIKNDGRNRLVTSAGARLSMSLGKYVSAFAQGATDDRAYDLEMDRFGYMRSSSGFRAAGGLLMDKGVLAGSEVYVGQMWQDFEDPRFHDVSKPYYSARIYWSPTPSTRITGFVDRTLQETTLPGASSYVESSYSVRIRQAFGDKVAVNMHAAYTRDSFQDYSRDDDIYDFGLGLRYNFNRYLFASADYRFLTRNSTEPLALYNKNQFTFSIGNRFPDTKEALPAGEYMAGSEDLSGLPDYSGLYAGVAASLSPAETLLTGPRSATGSLEADFGNMGFTVSPFAGYGWNLKRWYLGIEADGGVSWADWGHRNLPDGRVFSIAKDYNIGGSLRAGYCLPAALCYGKVGLEYASYHVTYIHAGTLFEKDSSLRGLRYGFGSEVPAGSHLFYRFEYMRTVYDQDSLNYLAPVGRSVDTFDNKDNTFTFGVGWRFRAQHPPTRKPGGYNGFYGGILLGYGVLESNVDSTHRDQPPPLTVTTYYNADFLGEGGAYAACAGYGVELGHIYLGMELEAGAGNAQWSHKRDGTARNFSVQKRSDYGAGLRLGYILDSGAMMYTRAGFVNGTFNTIYKKGNSPTKSTLTLNDKLYGLRLGIGIEFPIKGKLYWRSDYSYTGYEESSFTTAQDAPDDVRIDTREYYFRAGLVYHF